MGSAVLLGQLYHWSPADRHPRIRAHGLVPGSPPTTCTTRQPHLCLSPDPVTAWRLSAQTLLDAERGPASGYWDLWQVTLTDTDEIHIPPMFGPHLGEVQIHNAIAPDRVFFLGQRTITTAL